MAQEGHVSAQYSELRHIYFCCRVMPLRPSALFPSNRTALKKRTRQNAGTHVMSDCMVCRVRRPFDAERTSHLWPESGKGTANRQLFILFQAAHWFRHIPSNQPQNPGFSYSWRPLLRVISVSLFSPIDYTGGNALCLSNFDFPFRTGVIKKKERDFFHIYIIIELICLSRRFLFLSHIKSCLHHTCSIGGTLSIGSLKQETLFTKFISIQQLRMDLLNNLSAMGNHSFLIN